MPAKSVGKQHLLPASHALSTATAAEPIGKEVLVGQRVLARLDAVVWGVSDPKRGGGTTFGIFDHPGINHHPEIVTGVLESESKSILQSFFRARREERM